MKGVIFLKGGVFIFWGSRLHAGGLFEAELVKLFGTGADMCAVGGPVPWSTGMPPNTPTLVAMQRLLMRLSDGVT